MGVGCFPCCQTVKCQRHAWSCWYACILLVIACSPCLASINYIQLYARVSIVALLDRMFSTQGNFLRVRASFARPGWARSFSTHLGWARMFCARLGWSSCHCIHNTLCGKPFVMGVGWFPCCQTSKCQRHAWSCCTVSHRPLSLICKYPINVV